MDDTLTKACLGSRWRHLTRALQSRNYRLFFMGQGVSLVGTWMQRTALLWLIGTWFDEVRVAAFWLGVVGFCGQIPALVVAPLAGALADRWNRQRMVIALQTLAMVQAFILAALTLTHNIEMWHIIALSVWQGIVHAADVPTRQSFFIEIVERPENLTNAIALNSTIVNVGRLVGPALGGVLTAMFGVGVCFLLNAFSFLAVIVAFCVMRIKPRPAPTSRKPVLHNLIEGFQYAFRFPPIRALLLTMALVSLTGIPYASLLPVFTKHILAGGPQSYGMMVAGVAVGALLGAFYLASRASAHGLERVISLAPALMGGALIAFALSRSFVLSLLLMPLLGLGQMLLMASANTVLQTIVDDDKRGRIMSFYSLAFMGVVPLGNLLMGLVARQIGPAWTVALGGTVCIIVTINFRRKLSALQKLMHPIYVQKGIIPEVAARQPATNGPNGSAGVCTSAAPVGGSAS